MIFLYLIFILELGHLKEITGVFEIPVEIEIDLEM